MSCPRGTVRLLLALALLALGKLSWGAEIDWQSDVNAAWRQAREQDRPLLVFVSTANCRYCNMMQNVSFADPAVVRILERGFVAAAVDAKEVGWLVRDQKIGSFPTTLIISPGAEVLDRIKGYVKPAELKPRLEKTAAPARTAAKDADEKK